MKKTYYKQCDLQKGNMFQTSWIPEKFATLNRVLKLRDGDGKWDDGWVVIRAGQNRVEDSSMPDLHKEIRGHRKATGDSLPKNK